MQQTRETHGSEVDLNGSLWYTVPFSIWHSNVVLKLTSTGHYGITIPHMSVGGVCSEVDLNGSLWYIAASKLKLQPVVLKLTSTGHYGIDDAARDAYKRWF